MLGSNRERLRQVHERGVHLMRRQTIHSKTSAAGYALVVGLLMIAAVKGCGRFMDWRAERAGVELWSYGN